MFNCQLYNVTMFLQEALAVSFEYKNHSIFIQSPDWPWVNILTSLCNCQTYNRMIHVRQNSTLRTEAPEFVPGEPWPLTPLAWIGGPL